MAYEGAVSPVVSLSQLFDCTINVDYIVRQGSLFDLGQRLRLVKRACLSTSQP